MTEKTPVQELKTGELYREVSKRIDSWFELHEGETFDLDLICRQLEITSADGRKLAATKLRNEVLKGKLEKNNKIYRYIDNTIVPIDWANAESSNIMESVLWPYGVEDGSKFGFDNHVVIPQRGIVVIAGVSNTGKTTFALNFVYQNMDLHNILLMGSEYEPGQLKRRFSYMKYKNPFDCNGLPKFTTIERHENWKDVIDPKAINVIDWVNLGDQFYQLGKVIEGIKEKLDTGIALICIQKDAGKEFGMGGMWGVHLASLYLTMDYGRMTVEKCKEWNGHNPNKEMYGFDIIEHGSYFHNIRQVKLCKKCYGKSSGGKYKCPECYGKGYIDDTDDNG